MLGALSKGSTHKTRTQSLVNRRFALRCRTLELPAVVCLTFNKNLRWLGGVSSCQGQVEP